MLHRSSSSFKAGFLSRLEVGARDRLLQAPERAVRGGPGGWSAGTLWVLWEPEVPVLQWAVEEELAEHRRLEGYCLAVRSQTAMDQKALQAIGEISWTTEDLTRLGAT